MKITNAILISAVSLFGWNGKANAQWVQTTCPITNDIYSVAGNDSILFAGTGGDGGAGNGIYLSSDKGAHWATANTGLTAKFIQAILISGEKILIGTHGSGVFISTDGGGSWTSAGAPGTKVSAFVQNGAKVYASTESNGIYFSNDSGKTWSAKGIPGTSEVLTLACMGDKIFAGTQLGGVFISTDDGKTWTASNSGFPSQVLYCKAMAVIGTNLFVSLGGAQVYKSIDSGATWTRSSTGISNNVYSMLADGTDLYVGVTSGIYRSTDQGTTWAKVNTGFAVNPPTVNALGISGGNLYAGTIGLGVWSRPLSDIATGINQAARFAGKGAPANPSNGKWIFGFPKIGSNLNVSVYDIRGESIVRKQVDSENDPSSLSKGFYFFKAFNGTQDDNQKILLK